MDMYQENRRRVLDRLSTAGLPANSIILMQGGQAPTFFDTGTSPGTSRQLKVNLPHLLLSQTTSRCSSKKATSTTCLGSESQTSMAPLM